MTVTVLAALGQMELDIELERINDSVNERRAAGKDLGGRKAQFTKSQVRNTVRLIESGEPAAQVLRDVSQSEVVRSYGSIQVRYELTPTGLTGGPPSRPNRQSGSLKSR
ncbi:hypothetical protein [Arthrobacter sp. OY3WO11]|uniref:hypothetical protein n=1 Tax=Arthrobacter sp. OY3WO11 TaxID=1835723 RepID=UPI0012E73EFF|nr:hypothetical protein [Arthrobacter sp. OY3WO11]